MMASASMDAPRVAARMVAVSNNSVPGNRLLCNLDMGSSEEESSRFDIYISGIPFPRADGFFDQADIV